MNIRNATIDDLGAIIDMGSALQEESRKYDSLLIFDRQKAFTHYRNELSNDKAQIIVALNNAGDVVGYQYSFIVALDYLSSDNMECVFEAIFVLPEYRGSGYGSALTAVAENWAKKNQADRIKASIYIDNSTSIALHQKSGFIPFNIEYLKVINSNE